MSFWRNKKVVVTGGSGFLGSFLVEKLQSAGCDHIFIPRSSDYDLVDMEAVKRLYSDAQPDIVLHLAAAVGGIGANRTHPGEFFYKNLMMGVQMIEEGRLRKIEKFVIFGTICAYPKFAPIPFKEDELWNGYPEETNAPYGIAKKTILVQSQAYRQQYGFNSIYLLPVNLYGPRDNFDLETSHVIPALIRKCVEAKQNGIPEIVCWGDGSPTREFLYVGDAVNGILLASEKYNREEPVNLGTGVEISIKDLVEKIVQLTGYEGRVSWDTSKPNGQPRRCLDISRAKESFGFQAKVDFDEGLRRTIDWFLQNQSNIREVKFENPAVA
ncbi:MAG: GDP-L-fucose synthase [Caldithrix sp.]|nr:MAG: GDP-L-fucose synthase [Caldithrix sp.]